jgi:abnormal spindle-like microcephaly-associated protein
MVKRLMQGLHRNATVIQAAWRCFVLRAGYQRQRAAAVAVQAEVRRWQAQQQYQQQRLTAIVLQNAWRSFAARQQLQREAAAQAIQKHYKGYKVGINSPAGTYISPLR